MLEFFIQLNKGKINNETKSNFFLGVTCLQVQQCTEVHVRKEFNFHTSTQNNAAITQVGVLSPPF